MTTVIRWTIRLLAIVAASISIYLSVHTLRGGETLAGCGGGGAGCDEVLGSRWSQWLGIPVSLAGVGVYLAIFIATWMVPPGRAPWVRRIGRWLTLSLVPLAASAGIWFSALQWFELGSFCPYCLAVHACGLTIFVLVMITLYLDVRLIGRGMYRKDLPTELARADGGSPWPMAWGMLALIGLIVGQMAYTAPTYRVDQFRAVADDPVDIDDFAAASTETESPALTDDRSPVADVVEVTRGQSPSNDSDDLRASDGEVGESNSTHTAVTSATPGDGQVSAQASAQVSSRASAAPPAAGDQQFTISADMAAWRALVGDGKPDLKHSVAIAPDDRRRQLLLLGGRARLNVYKHPVYGAPDARHLLAYMFDYTCRHCHIMWGNVSEATKDLGPQVGIVLIPVPLSQPCNQLMSKSAYYNENACRMAQLALGMWYTDRDRFREFHEWMMTPEDPPALADAIEFASQLVDRAALRESMLSLLVEARIKSNVFLYGRSGKGSVPKTFLGSELISGTVEDVRELTGLIRQHLSIVPGSLPQ